MPVESQSLRSVGYDLARRLLEVEFTSGDLYRYFDVPPEWHRMLMAAASKGTWFNQVFKSLGFAYPRVECPVALNFSAPAPASIAYRTNPRNGRFTRSEKSMSDHHTYKLIELVGSSPNSIEEAIQNAIAQASQSLKLLEWFEVVNTRGHLKDGKVGHFQVTLKVGFRLVES